MAIGNAAAWEVRTAAGSDTNGGGFIRGASGTDYSQQNSKNTSGNNISTTDASFSGTTLSSATASFTSAIVGNVIYVNGAWYQVTVFTNSTTVTVDRSGSGSSLTMNIGGALATLTQAVTNAQQNNLIYCTGSQTTTATVTLSLAVSGSGSLASDYLSYSIIGYGSTRGDGGQFTLQTSTNSVNGITIASGAGQILLQNLLIKCTAGTPGDGIIAGTSGGSYDLFLDNCRITGWNEGIRSPFSTQYWILPITLHNCEVDSNTSHGVHSIAFTALFDCYIYNNGGIGFFMDTASGQASAGFVSHNTTYQSNTTAGIKHSGSVGSSVSTAPGYMTNNAFIGNGIGYQMNVNAATVLFENNIVYNNTTGVEGTTAMTIVGIVRNNFFYNNGTARTNFPVGSGDITGTGNPFTSTTGGSPNLALNTTSGAGAACRAAGFPGVLQVGGTGYVDIGPLQHQDSGGATVVISPNITRYYQTENEDAI